MASWPFLGAGGRNPRATFAQQLIGQLGARSVLRRGWRQVAAERLIVPICDTQPKDAIVVTDALPISRFPVPDLADMPEDIRNRILAVQEKSGFIPNVFLVLAHRPDEFRAFFAYHDALMEKSGNLTKAEREMIVVATSNANQCQYCVIAHGAILRIRAKNPLISDQVAINYRKADITERQKAMLDFALKVSRSAETVGEADFDVLKSHGFDEEDIWDIAGIAAFFALSNRMANVTAMRPNAQFYTMGRS
jgi:4-carboxymuconolactone decarboxylase